MRKDWYPLVSSNDLNAGADCVLVLIWMIDLGLGCIGERSKRGESNFMNLEESMRLSTAQAKYNCEPIISHTALGMIHEEAVLRLLNDLDNEIADCRKEAAKLSSKSDILAAWKLKIEKDLLNQTYE